MDDIPINKAILKKARKIQEILEKDDVFAPGVCSCGNNLLHPSRTQLDNIDKLLPEAKISFVDVDSLCAECASKL